ncbi:MAG TPA: hypothetical protein VGP85_02490 [Pyrinomonadaceae bacterium]|nr:hypothetical protein [Pyrinomonadaceae bacterium]
MTPTANDEVAARYDRSDSVFIWTEEAMNIQSLYRCCFSILLIAFASISVLGQSDADLEQRVFNLGILRTGRSNNKNDRKGVDAKALLAQVQEDFSKLQVANNELAEASEKREELDLHFAATTLKEIQLRAERLMENLTQSKVKRIEIGQILSDKKQLKNLIMSLDTAVGEFAHNRVFFEASPDDEKLAKKALKDLDQIIGITAQLSRAIETERDP